MREEIVEPNIKYSKIGESVLSSLSLEENQTYRSRYQAGLQDHKGLQNAQNQLIHGKVHH